MGRGVDDGRSLHFEGGVWRMGRIRVWAGSEFGGWNLRMVAGLRELVGSKFGGRNLRMGAGLQGWGGV